MLLWDWQILNLHTSVPLLYRHTITPATTAAPRAQRPQPLAAALTRQRRAPALRVRAQAPVEQQKQTQQTQQQQKAPSGAPVLSPEQQQAGAGADAPASVRLPWPRKRDWASVALDKVADTVEDVLLMARRGAEAPAR